MVECKIPVAKGFEFKRMGRTTKGKQAIESMRLAYRSAKDCGDKEEEAKWANQIGHAYKDAGEYVVALKWFRIDYEISTRRSCVLEPVKLMPTCQSMGEVYLRLHNYDEALVYQSKHFHLAEQAGDLVEQQRASTQLGRTYLELYEIADRHSALNDAKLYFQTALDLALKLKSNPPAGEKSSSFVVEFVDAHNNVGLARALSEDYEGAFRFYSDGLQLCDEEEVDAYDAARTRIHHNLGRLYVDLRDWDKAKQHIDMDILICQSIPHAQGESKGLMNKGQLFFKRQDYEQATRCFRRALQIAQTLEDEDQLCLSIKDNIEVVEQAKIKAKAMEADMQRLSSLRRDVAASKGTACERKLFKQESKLLQDLIQQAEELHGWGVHLGLAKSLKRLSNELGDKELLADALEIVASSYYNIRDFDKAIKWHWKSFQQCKRIGHLEGQTVAKINYGNALDAAGRCKEALKAYKEAYQVAKKLHNPKKIDQQMSALDNVHYLYLVRLGNVEKARKVEVQRKRLQNSRDTPSVLNDDREERCSETGSEGPSEDHGMAEVSTMPFHESDDIDVRASNLASQRLKVVVSDSDQESDDNIPPPSARPTIGSRRPRQESSSTLLPEQPKSRNSKLSSKDQLNSPMQSGGRENVTSGPQQRKLFRAHKKVVISDEEMDDLSEAEFGRQSKLRREPCTVEDSESDHPFGETRKIRRIVPSNKRSAVERLNLSSDEDTPTPSGKKLRSCRTSPPSPSPDFFSSPGHDDFDILSDNDLISMAPNLQLPAKTANIPNLRSPNPATAAQAAELSRSQRKSFEASPGSPILVATDRSATIMAADRGAESLVSSKQKHPPEKRTARFSVPENVSGDLHASGATSDLDVAGCVRSPLVDRYLTHCIAAGITPNSIMKHKLESQKASEEVVVAGCNMEDTDALPLLVALKESDAFSLLDMSHNSLGNATVHAIQDLIKSTNQTDLGLTLDLHCNKLGAGALMQLCHCPVSLSRLEVLNLSGNRLTDAAARNLCKIVKESQALAALNLEGCGLTSRSITQLTSSIPLDSSLTKLWIGKNRPVAGLAIQELLNKLSSLTSFSELDLKGLELDDAAVAGVCTLVLKSKSISALNLQGTDIANEEAIALSNALDSTSLRLSKLDLSFNVFNRASAVTLCSRLISIHSLSTLNLSGNNLDQEAVEAISRGLARISCRLKVLDLSKCRLGQSSVLLIMHSLQDHPTLIDLNLSGNVSTSSLKLSHSTLEVSELQAESSSTKRVRANITVDDDLQTGECHSQGLQDCSATSLQEGVAVQVYCSQARASCVTGGLGEEAEQKAVANSDGDIHSGLPDLADGISESVAEGDDTGHKDGLPSKIDGMPVPVCGSASDAAVADERRVQEENCEGRLGSSVQDDSRRQGEEPVQTSDAPEEVNLVSRATEEGCQPDETSEPALKVKGPAAESSCATGANDGFCEQLAAAIRMAKGLRLLDLTDNELGEDDVKRLYLSWSSCPRGTSTHRQHVDGLTAVHFFVETRACPCSFPPCCTAHSFTTC